MNTIDKKIENLKKEIVVLEEQKKKEMEEKKNSLPMYLARKLHEHCCHHNHIDACGWYYEEKSGNFEGASHQIWLEKANTILNATQGRVSVDDIIEIASLL